MRDSTLVGVAPDMLLVWSGVCFVLVLSYRQSTVVSSKASKEKKIQVCSVELIRKVFNNVEQT